MNNGPPVVARAYPELTWVALVTGWFIGAIIAVAIGYAALILGFSIEGSELAAILGFGILRGMLRRKSIVENNIVQTIASGVNGASSGMMFSVPALFLLGFGDQFNPYLLTFGCIAGAFLGIAFIIPLRKHMIDYERLTYPGGVAVATILKSPGAGVRKAIILLVAALISAIVHFTTLKTGVSNWNLGAIIGMPEYMNGIWYLSLMTVGVGFIAGRGGIAFIIGGFVAYWFLSPALSLMNAFPLDEVGQVINEPGPLRLLLYRPFGIGMLIGGAVMGVILASPLIVSAVKSMQKAAKVTTGISKDEMPIKLLYFAVLGPNDDEAPNATDPAARRRYNRRSADQRTATRARRSDYSLFLAPQCCSASWRYSLYRQSVSAAASAWRYSARCGSGWRASSCQRPSVAPTGRRCPA